MKRLAILGAGEHGRVVADSALCAGWQEIVFFDDRWPESTRCGIWTVQGNFEVFLSSPHRFDGVVVAVGKNVVRLQWLRKLQENGAPLVNVIHPAATVSQFAELGTGSVLMAGAVVNTDAQLGMGVIVNTGATIDHDCKLQDGVHISPGAHLAGGVHVAECAWIGIGASVRETIRIGAHSIVGAGAAVVGDVVDRCTVAGVPARTIQHNEEGRSDAFAGQGSC